MDLLAPWALLMIVVLYSQKPGTLTIHPRNSEIASLNYVL